MAPASGTAWLSDLPSGMRTRDSNGVTVAELESEPSILTIRRKTRGGSEDGALRRASALDGDDEISFNMDSAVVIENGHDVDEADSEGPTAKTKGKRKSSAEKFLEDNVNYFQLEVLPSKTRSTKPVNGNDTLGYHNSFLDFLKSKEVEGGEESDDVTDGASRARSRHKSGPVGGLPSSRGARPRASSFHQRAPPRSDSEESLVRRPSRSRSRLRNARSRSRVRSRSARQLDGSPSDSETEAIVSKKCKTPRKRATQAAESSDDER